MRDDTFLVHAGRDPAAQQGMVNPPVYHASTVLFPTVAALRKAAANPFEGVYYGRYGTPVHFALEEAVAQLEGAHASVSTCSGLAAISVALLSVVSAGSHLLVADNIYGPTRNLCDGLLARMGVTTTYFDPLIGADIASLIQPETVAVFIEAPGSLSFEMPDVPAIVVQAKRNNCLTIIDNTWATPLYFRAFEHGVDISIHAATKYIVGHADAMLGLVNCNEKTHMRVRKMATQLGYCAGPDDVYLGLRGLRTLSPRLRQHQASALTLCEWLQAQPQVERVLYPALANDPGHALWQRDFTGASGLFSAVLKPTSDTALAAMLDDLKLFGMGFSWGGYESLVLPTHPGDYRSVTHWPHSGPTLRIHAGLEDPHDLIEDLAAGFARLDAASG